jgi:LysR family transcriptional regulator, hypochlorite-specific transcription factor HypT
MGPDNRPLDLEWLEDFLVLADSGNFSRAAELRAIAQPAFSRHIKSLEEWVGVGLVDRSAHPVTLTEAGKRFQPEVKSLLEELLAARHAARAVDAMAAQRLRFAATHVLSLRFFPDWLAAVEARLSLGPIEVVSDNMAACEELMLQRKVQFLLCHSQPSVSNRLDDVQFMSTRVSEDVLMPVAAQKAAAKADWHIGDKASTDLPVLAYSEASGLGRIMRTLLPEAFQGRHIVFTAHHAELLKTMVLEGRGIAWLPRSLIDEDLKSGRLQVAGSPRWQVPLDIRLFRRRATQSDATEAFWHAISTI